MSFYSRRFIQTEFWCCSAPTIDRGTWIQVWSMRAPSWRGGGDLHGLDQCHVRGWFISLRTQTVKTTDLRPDFSGRLLLKWVLVYWLRLFTGKYESCTHLNIETSYFGIIGMLNIFNLKVKTHLLSQWNKGLCFIFSAHCRQMWKQKTLTVTESFSE